MVEALARLWHCVIRNRHDMEPRIAHTNQIPPNRIPQGREFRHKGEYTNPQELPYARCRRCRVVALQWRQP